MKLSGTVVDGLFYIYCMVAFIAVRFFELYQEEHPPQDEYKPYKPKPSDYGPAVIHEHPMHGGDGTIGIGYPLYWDGTYDTVDDDDCHETPPPDKTGSYYWDSKFKVWVPLGTALGYQMADPSVTGNFQTYIGTEPLPINTAGLDTAVGKENLPNITSKKR